MKSSPAERLLYIYTRYTDTHLKTSLPPPPFSGTPSRPRPDEKKREREKHPLFSYFCALRLTKDKSLGIPDRPIPSVIPSAACRCPPRPEPGNAMCLLANLVIGSKEGVVQQRREQTRPEPTSVAAAGCSSCSCVPLTRSHVWRASCPFVTVSFSFSFFLRKPQVGCQFRWLLPIHLLWPRLGAARRDCPHVPKARPRS